MADEVSQQPRFRKLRIAWSVGCAIICLLLIVLWLRSYWYDHLVRGPFLKSIELRLQSEVGWLRLGMRRGTHSPSRWSLKCENTEKRNKEELDFIATGGTVTRKPYSFGLYTPLRAYYLEVPHWFVLLMVATLALAPWLPWRFSLRTLLIATTLVAVVLGIAVWAGRK